MVREVSGFSFDEFPVKTAPHAKRGGRIRQHPGTAGRTGLAALQQALGICTDGAEWRDGTLPLPWLRTRQIRGLTLHRSNNSPALVKKKPKRGCIDEGEMKGISGYRFSSNCSAVIVALPSAAKVMPSADWGV